MNGLALKQAFCLAHRLRAVTKYLQTQKDSRKGCHSKLLRGGKLKGY